LGKEVIPFFFFKVKNKIFKIKKKKKKKKKRKKKKKKRKRIEAISIIKQNNSNPTIKSSAQRDSVEKNYPLLKPKTRLGPYSI
jgi:hypothetical protein